jgi:hypothetical protein
LLHAEELVQEAFPEKLSLEHLEMLALQIILLLYIESIDAEQLFGIFLIEGFLLWLRSKALEL